MTQTALLERLEADLKTILEEIRQSMPLTDEAVLQYRVEPQAWTIAECCAHLNAFYDIYLPRLEQAIHKSKARQWAPTSTVRMTMSAKSAIRKADPANGRAYKAKKKYNFYQQNAGKLDLKSFMINTERLLRIIHNAKEIDLNQPKIQVGTSYFKRYTPGNTIEWLVLHTRRHINQIQSYLLQLKLKGLSG